MKSLARQMSLPDALLAAIQSQLITLGANQQDPFKSLSRDILQLSNSYHTPGTLTPWREVWAQRALLAYYLPLNLVRLLAVLSEINKFNLFERITHVVDFGSGPGTVHLALELSGLGHGQIDNIEISLEARQFHQSLIQLIAPQPRWSARWPTRSTHSEISPNPSMAARPNSLALASYSLHEDWSIENQLLAYDNVGLIFPSTQLEGRKLLDLRARWIERGYVCLAPCTHQLSCPLLSESNKDWCHDRIFWNKQDWFSKLEAHLPMKNDTLTFSYLILTRNPDLKALSSPNRARVIGDTLYERGKIRQLICRGPQREFLSWLTRHGEPKELVRGTIVHLPENLEIKGYELRCPPGTVIQ